MAAKSAKKAARSGSRSAAKAHDQVVRRFRLLLARRTRLLQRLMDALDPVLNVAEVADLLSVCRTTVRRHTNRGLLRCFRTGGNHRRFRLSDVLEFQEAQQEEEDAT